MVAMVLSSCDELEDQAGYCEIAFAYDYDEEMPDLIDKDRIGCACTTGGKDLLRGQDKGVWELVSLNECRRIRGFHPNRWKKTIDPYFQEQSKKYENK